VYLSPADFQTLQSRVRSAEASVTADDSILVTLNGLVFTAR
jgi:hypothetical protein